jgi:bifunctional DNA-binding transcriptional regulator/antitoxin component of YhaV-PrlF toxin-antitoxin module
MNTKKEKTNMKNEEHAVRITMDRTGRLVVPASVRQTIGLLRGGAIDLLPAENGCWLLRPAEPSCCICGTKSGLQELSNHFPEKYICGVCRKKLRQALTISDNHTQQP